MKSPAYGLFLAFVVALAGNPLRTEAQDMTKSQAARGVNAKEAQAIQAVIDGAWEALRKQDLNAFRQHCSDPWLLYTARGNKFSADKLFAVHKANIRDFRLVASNVRIRVAGDIAWATYDAELSGQLKGEPWGGSFIFTNIFRKKDGKWLCIHMHESKRDKP
jgi:ketosteroid isomerase-like protein